MRAEFFFVPIALVAAGPVMGQSMIGVAESQQRLFPGATFKPSFFDLTDAEYEAIHKKSGVLAYHRDVKAWRVSSGGWYILDQVIGRDDWISYAVGLDKDGTVKGIEILECDARYDGITNPAWLRQFIGLGHRTVRLDIQNMSGASLSSAHVADGVKRLFATYELVLAARNL